MIVGDNALAHITLNLLSIPRIGLTDVAGQTIANCAVFALLCWV